MDEQYLAYLKLAFEAGQAFENECHCGTCDYCLDVKTEDAPDFEKWVTELIISRTFKTIADV